MEYLVILVLLLIVATGYIEAVKKIRAIKNNRQTHHLLSVIF